jgi:hypothetical protein
MVPPKDEGGRMMDEKSYNLPTTQIHYSPFFQSRLYFFNDGYKYCYKLIGFFDERFHFLSRNDIGFDEQI